MCQQTDGLVYGCGIIAAGRDWTRVYQGGAATTASSAQHSAHGKTERRRAKPSTEPGTSTKAQPPLARMLDGVQLEELDDDVARALPPPASTQTSSAIAPLETASLPSDRVTAATFQGADQAVVAGVAAVWSSICQIGCRFGQWKERAKTPH